MEFKRENRTTQAPENLREKLVVGKNHGTERDIPLMLKDYSGCSELYYEFYFLGVRSLAQEEKINLYSRGTVS